MTERDDLIAGAGKTLEAWTAWRKRRTLLSEYPPDENVYEPLSAAIAASATFRAVNGQSLFSGYSGVVLAPNSLAIPALYAAIDAQEKPEEVAADWLLHVLSTKEASGKFYAPIWGLAVDENVEIADGVRLIQFESMEDGDMKRRLLERAEEIWNKTVWQSQRYYDTPASAIVRHVERVQYIGDPRPPFELLNALEWETREHLAFLQASATVSPLVAGTWFEWDDAALDFNRHENFMSWQVPEIEPRVKTHIAAKGKDLAAAWARMVGLPNGWQKKLLRSMERFVLSQCRLQLADRALDLTIAFEIAVGGGPGDNSAPRWKVTVRSAQLVGGELAERQRLRKILNDLYDIRNKVSHGGTIAAAEAQQFEETIMAAAETYRSLVNAALELGTEPDWRALELQPRV